MDIKRAVIYVRTEQPSEIAMQAQHGACLEFCQRYHFTVVGTLTEAVPGGTLDSRPKLDELRRMLREHHVDTVVVHTVDRLSRDFVALIALSREAEEYGVVIHSVMEIVAGELTPLRVAAMLAERERLAILIRSRENTVTQCNRQEA